MKYGTSKYMTPGLRKDYRKAARLNKKLYRYKRVGNTTVRRVVRSELNKQEETKQFNTFLGVASPTLTNNEIFTIAPTQGIVLGTTDEQRIGSSIYLKNLKSRFTFTGALASLNATFRVIAVWLEKERAVPAISAANAGVIENDLFMPNYRMVNALIDNKYEHNIVFDKTIKVMSNNTSIPQGFLELSVPINKKVQYVTNTSVYFKEKQLYIAFVCSVPAASTGVASSWQVNVDNLVTYKDS